MDEDEHEGDGGEKFDNAEDACEKEGGGDRREAGGHEDCWCVLDIC
jgi:hypothetical protein